MNTQTETGACNIWCMYRHMAEICCQCVCSLKTYETSRICGDVSMLQTEGYMYARYAEHPRRRNTRLSNAFHLPARDRIWAPSSSAPLRQRSSLDFVCAISKTTSGGREGRRAQLEPAFLSSLWRRVFVTVKQSQSQDQIQISPLLKPHTPLSSQSSQKLSTAEQSALLDQICRQVLLQYPRLAESGLYN